jgi:transposase-like protein
VEELTQERGLRVDHSTIYRWVQAYSPQLDKRCRRHLRPISRSWRVDEVYVNIKGQGRWLYQAVDKHGDTLDFLLSAKRDTVAAKRFFRTTR